MNPLEFLYFLGYSIHKEYGTKHQQRLPCKVISIGNITTGGTGKTPAAIAIAEKARKRGFRPCILTRGYKGKADGPCFVSKGDEPLLDVYLAGDEALLLARKLQGIPVIKGKDRHAGGLFALNSLPSDMRPDLFILDDGFQHWTLFRDKNILLIDSTNPFGNRRLLPLGPLREPLHAIARADIMVLTKSTRQEIGEALTEEIRRHNHTVPLFYAEHVPAGFLSQKEESFPPRWAQGRRVFGFCGIGNPRSFQQTLLSTGAEIKGLLSFRDHHSYTAREVNMVAENAQSSGADWIVTTEKDIMRLKGFHLPENLVSLTVEFSIDEHFYDTVFAL
jgi:tetraacyldisaccharide 4'-kinase